MEREESLEPVVGAQAEAEPPAPEPVKEPFDYMQLGFGLTALYLIFFGWLVYPQISELRLKALNEIGDFLAGAFGPVAFLWLVLGFLQQREELNQNTKELRKQANELEKSVIEQARQAQATREMIDLEVKKTRAAMQPLFVPMLTSYNPENNVLLISFINRGYPATKINLSFPDDQEFFAMWGHTRPIIGTEEKLDLSVEISGMTFPTQILMQYLDGLRDLNQELFFLEKKQLPNEPMPRFYINGADDYD